MSAVGALLAIETATETVGVAVRTADGVQAELTVTGRRRHVEALTPAVQHVLEQVGLTPSDLDAVAVDIGPGLFTGLRVGVSAAKGLAQALGIGVITCNSLEVLLHAAAPGRHGRALAAVDARRGEVFAMTATLDAAGAVRDMGQPLLLTPGDLAELAASTGGDPLLVVGDGAQRYAGHLTAIAGVTVVRDALAWPPPSTLLALAAAQLAAGAAPESPQQVVPLYMREADAVSNFTQVAR
jgi:tRNA threonylcarbamoyladenosine biosynthesis protein TsaB